MSCFYSLISKREWIVYPYAVYMYIAQDRELTYMYIHTPIPQVDLQYTETACSKRLTRSRFITSHPTTPNSITPYKHVLCYDIRPMMLLQLITTNFNESTSPIIRCQFLLFQISKNTTCPLSALNLSHKQQNPPDPGGDPSVLDTLLRPVSKYGSKQTFPGPQRPYVTGKPYTHYQHHTPPHTATYRHIPPPPATPPIPPKRSQRTT